MKTRCSFLILLSLLMPSCESASQSCGELCTKFTSCGVAIPSSDTCRSECAGSEVVKQQLEECLARMEPGDPAAYGYCPGSTCQETLRCVEDAFGESVHPLPIWAGFTLEDMNYYEPEQLSCGPHTIPVVAVIDEAVAPATCTALDLEWAQLAVENTSTHDLLLSGPCVEVLSVGWAQYQVANAGHMQLSARLWASDGTCMKVYGTPLHVPLSGGAGFESIDGHVPLSLTPTSYTCEVCDNGADDDGDAFTDCNDPECKYMCSF